MGIKFQVVFLVASVLIAHTAFAVSPVFSDYNAAAFKQTARPIRITPSNKYFRTVLTALSKQSLNFSENYRFDTIGCGGGCGQGIIYNAKTGYAGLLPQSYRDCYSEKYGFTSYDFEFQKDSRLLIATGRRGGEVHNCEVVYYLIDGNQFKEILKKPVWP